MIVFDLECRSGGHRFEGWFGSSDDFLHQQEQGLVNCPECGSADVGKAVMAPNVGRKGNQISDASARRKALSNGSPMLAEAAMMMRRLWQMQAEALKNSRWVGDRFAEDVRAMHYGEREVENIHGEATLAEAKALHEEGIAVLPLPFPVAPPGKAN
ncbi:MAG: DUF1178 family protein [Novosphingobium sp.]|nr:DUF1178 family protein [Novosphingobium sp.]